MGAYNILVANVMCPNCHNIYEGKIQFKYADTWQLQYRIGDKLKWGGNDIGTPDIPKVKVYGILESDTCPICNQTNFEDEFDIYIENNVLTGVSKIESIDDYHLNDGNYAVLH